jgi:short-subunit dehydrogenase
MRKQFRDLTNVISIEADLMAPEEAWSEIEKHLDPDNLPLRLINNAGVLDPGDTTEWTEEALERSFQVNAYAPMTMIRRILPFMHEAGYGRIISVTSGAPLNCAAGYGLYSASKAALNAFTVTCAREHQDTDIKINLMSPGPVRSEMAPEMELLPEVCFPTVDYLLELDASGPTGRFFWLGYEIPLTPDLSGVNWMEGRADDRFDRIL